MTAAVFCTVSATTKRNTDLGGGKRGAAVTHLIGLAITPLWPLSGETVRLLGITGGQLRELKECYHVPAAGVALPDVAEGDVLVVAGAEYPISYVSEWTDSAAPSLHIVVGEVKQST